MPWLQSDTMNCSTEFTSGVHLSQTSIFYTGGREDSGNPQSTVSSVSKKLCYKEGYLEKLLVRESITPNRKNKIGKSG